MSKVRINDLARELEVKSKAILDVLAEAGVTEKKTHSSSLEDFEADKVRNVLRGGSGGQSSARAPRVSRPEPDGIKTQIDQSNISKPGDVLKAIISKQAPAVPPPAPVRPTIVPPAEARPAVSSAPPQPHASVTPPVASTPSAAGSPSLPVAPPAPKLVTPGTQVRPTFTVPPPKPVTPSAPAGVQG